MKQLLIRLINGVLRRFGLMKRLSNVYFNIIYGNIRTFETEINGIKTFFSTEDDYSIRWFFPRYKGGKIHEKQVTEAILNTLKGATCFVDVGTNLGWYTCLACKHMPNGVVYGFEMDDQNFDLLQKNIAINNCKNAKLQHVAVTDTQGKLSYQKNIDAPSATFRIASDGDTADTCDLVSVDAITMDAFFEDKELKPDVIKIDVEGAEMNVLKGMKKILQIKKPVLFIEVHPWNLSAFHSSPSEIFSFLIDNRYDVYEIEDMRAFDGNKSLRKLNKTSELNGNPMLFATRHSRCSQYC